ncbi:hypothetical protein GOODEAATRI_003045, partial [Goodea atripinnis]
MAGRGDVHTQQKFSAVERHVSHKGYYCGAGRGTAVLRDGPLIRTALQLAGGHTAEMCPPLQTAGASLYNQAYVIGCMSRVSISLRLAGGGHVGVVMVRGCMDGSEGYA